MQFAVGALCEAQIRIEDAMLSKSDRFRGRGGIVPFLDPRLACKQSRIDSSKWEVAICVHDTFR